MQKYLPFLILVFLLGLIAVSTYNLNKKQELENSTPQFNELDDGGVHFARQIIKLPQFSLPDLYKDNAEFSKKDLKGKYSIINFFASWCLTCRAEHDILMRLQSENIIDIYGIAWNDIGENTKNYLQKAGNPFKKVAKDNRGLFSEIIGIKSIPETLIIDPKGNVVMRYRGNLQDFSIAEIREFLRKNR